jgi:DNA (cytosine-5)-methyltransferase 1
MFSTEQRLAWDSPSCTVDTRFGEPRYFLHPNHHRGFTVREAARIQGFPDNFIFEGALKTQYRLVGNAVPPPMARTMGIFARRLLGRI